MAYDSSEDLIFITSGNSGIYSTVSVVSDNTNSFVTNITKGYNPHGIAYDSAKDEMFVANNADGQVIVISNSSNIVVSPSSTALASPTKNQHFSFLLKGIIAVAIAATIILFVTSILIARRSASRRNHPVG